MYIIVYWLYTIVICFYISLVAEDTFSYTVKPLFSRGSIFCGFRDFLKIRENQTRKKLPNSMIIEEKTRELRTLDPAESYKAADREK